MTGLQGPNFPLPCLLPTTVVGSYPAIPRRGLSSLLDPYRAAVATAVGDQMRAGVHIISDGQVRGEMIQAFSSRLPGVRGQEVIGPIQPPGVPITLHDTREALKSSKWVKGILTGPSTIAHGLKIATPIYRDRGDLALDLARALAPEARALQAAGVSILQVDEPIFSTGVADLMMGREALAVLTASLNVPVCLHVCGDIGAVIDHILTFPLTVLDIEAANNPDNLSTLSRKDLAGRLVGLGVVDTASANVEGAGVIEERIRRGLEVLSPESVLIDPDCGMRMLSRDVAFKKLCHMTEAAAVVRHEIKGT
jgi:5-methyltetrahydropteroyltriglutamate--homocysteine methyltransferase